MGIVNWRLFGMDKAVIAWYARAMRVFSGKKLRKAREAAGMSRMDLAKAINFTVGPENIGRYEAGDVKISLNVAIRLASTLGISLKELTDAASDSER